MTHSDPAPDEDLTSLDAMLDADDETPRLRRRPRRRRVLIGLLSAFLLLTLVPVGGAAYVAHRLDGNIDRLPGVFTGLPDRPARATGPAADAMNILVLGTDRRSAVPTTGTAAAAPAWVAGEQRSDTMMLVHLDADREGATVVSLPRDSWVSVPGHGHAKVNAAYSYGGPRLAVQTFEDLTGVRVDHVVVVDWSGFAALTDAMGGVSVDVPATVRDSARGITWTAGRHHLDGREALDYVGQRYGLPGGDLDRVRRQQAFLRSLMNDSLHQEMRRSPRLLYGFLDTLTRHIAVDAGWSVTEMGSLGWSLRNLRSADIDYLTVPVSGLDRVRGQSIVRLDASAGRELWKAVRDDRLDTWTADHPGLLTPQVVR